MGYPGCRRVETTCPYCGVGCGIVLQVNPQEQILGMVEDVPENPSSRGMLCVKGRFGTGFVHHPSRLKKPLIRKGGSLVEASWEEALDVIAERLAGYRGEEFAALASAKATNEDGYVMQKFVRVVMGTNSIDHCTRLCHAPSVEAMLTSLGSGATSNSYMDYEEAGCLMVVGSDSSANHPVIAVRFRKAVQKHGAKLIVVNPKWIDLCSYADLWLRQNPGTDVALFNGLARIVLDEGWEDREFIEGRTENFAEWKASLEEYTSRRVSRITGVPEEDLRAAARYYARPAHGGSCLIWGMGITQHINGTANAHALLNLALVTGQMGKPASGISPLRGQNNVQGCGDAGCIPDSLPGYQPVGSPAARAKFAAKWGVPIPESEGLRVTEMVEAAMAGKLRAMYIVGENPLLSEADLHHAREAVSKLEFLVVQDLFLHETAEIAHVVLPACSFAEKDGTFTNSERRVQRVRRAIAPTGETRPDTEIICEVARRVLQKRGRSAEGFDFAGPAEVFSEMASLVPFLAGINYQRLEKAGIQWPCPAPDHPGTRYLYSEGFPRGRGKFVPVYQGSPADELPDEEYPLILNTGRILYHWHGGTLTRRVEGLLALAPRLEVAIHPNDASRYGLQPGAPVRLSSRRGDLTGVAKVTAAVREGEVFVPFVRIEESAANFLTNSAHDPSSRIPEYKVCAVRLEPVHH
ncbi:MAG: formate dehydrogenase subunit alpha [Candidatus Tectomicrobia bacterium]|uniref:nitrate reductase (cytochrome) n=1 Tax=Tectimicrobiota bacterium TaxID=2528274 RepID=A0A932GQI5_UNCTE|nr:formate dehydrogenase subunit alpha [Candidatus Tectomicrobia bacterium]